MRIGRLAVVLAVVGLLQLSCLQTVSQQQAASRPARSRSPRATARPGAAMAAPAEPARFPKPAPFTPAPHPGKTGNEYTDRFVAHWNALHSPANGYFSPEGMPYHAAETLLVEAPDYGHHTTSEAYSYWLWLEASYGKIAKDWKPLGHAWENLEAYLIPSQERIRPAMSGSASRPGRWTEWRSSTMSPATHTPGSCSTTGSSG